MSLPALDHFLKKHKRIGLDSNILIYFIEAAPAYRKLSRHIFESIESGECEAVCSALTLLEVLTQPYRNDNEELVSEFYGLLTTYPNLIWVDMGVKIADLGAQLRAKYKLKTPDVW